jgi:hypothetical protein
LKITLRFKAGEIATFERGEWTCADETLLACCNVRTRRISPETQPDFFLRTVRLFAGRMNAGLTIEIDPDILNGTDPQHL